MKGPSLHTLPQRVRVVGAGLLGTSVALALRTRGVDVTLVDTSPVSAALAADMGAGTVAGPDDAPPDVVLVAAPPDVTAAVVTAELTAWPDAVVTDVASVKSRIVDAVVAEAGAGAGRYVPGHPMAGRERSGAVAARSDLFHGRTWVVCSDGHETSRVALVRSLAEATGAKVVTMSPHEHDQAVAAVSHVPQLAASLVATQLKDLSEHAVNLSGQGVRDVTRIAASDPLLWTQILAGNADAILPVVDRMLDELGGVRDALQAVARAQTGGTTDPDVESSGAGRLGPRAVLARTIADGQEGQARIPGKHGTPRTAYTTVAVIIPDEPGSLGKVFTLVGDSGLSVEDLRLEHDSGVAAGLLEMDVLPVRAETLRTLFTDHGWSAHIVETN